MIVDVPVISVPDPLAQMWQVLAMSGAIDFQLVHGVTVAVAAARKIVTSQVASPSVSVNPLS